MSEVHAVDGPLEAVAASGGSSDVEALVTAHPDADFFICGPSA